MIRLVTQYTNIHRHNKPFPTGQGWDGATGPYVCHLILEDDAGQHQKSIAKYSKNGDVTVEDWLYRPFCLNSFRLELGYE